MGNTATSEANEEDEFAQFDGIETLGYRVLGVQPESPGKKTVSLVTFQHKIGKCPNSSVSFFCFSGKGWSCKFL